MLPFAPLKKLSKQGAVRGALAGVAVAALLMTGLAAMGGFAIPAVGLFLAKSAFVGYFFGFIGGGIGNALQQQKEETAAAKPATIKTEAAPKTKLGKKIGTTFNAMRSRRAQKRNSPKSAPPTLG